MDAGSVAVRRLLWAAGIAIVTLSTGALFVTQASAQDELVKIDRLTVAVGEEGTLDLEAIDIGSPGLGAWQVGIVYNDSFVEAIDCDAGPVGVNYCNADFADGRIEVVGASADGEAGDTTLASMTFHCEDEGNTSLTIVLDDFADATEGSPDESMPTASTAPSPV